MSIRTYTANSMTAAYAMVKRHLGDRAVILQTRTVRRGGLFGIGARTCVQIIAADERDVRPAGRNGVPVRPAKTAASFSTGELIRTVYKAARAESGQAAPIADRVAQTSKKDHVSVSGSRVPPPLAVVSSDAGMPASSPPELEPARVDHGLQQEMTAVRQMVSQLLLGRETSEGNAVAEGRVSPGVDRLFDHYLNLLKHDVSQEIANDIVEHVRTTVSPDDCADPEKVRAAVAERIEALLPFDEEAGVWSAKQTGTPRVIALVGPTGVGKTTTVAKLAANFKLKGGCNVGLITIDTYRIAAVDQLRTYAEIIGVPLHVVLSPEELGEAIRRCAGCDVVLIDTAGRSQRDGDKLEELEAFMAAARPDEIHLVLSSTCAQQVILDTIDKFSRIDVDRVIFTKLDEAVTVGVVLNAVRKINKRLSFVTTGQDVPHHIEPGRATSIVSRMLGEGNDP